MILIDEVRGPARSRESVLSSWWRSQTSECSRARSKSLTLAVLEKLEEDVKPFALNAIVLHHDATAANDLAGVALLVNLAKTSPGAENFCIANFDKIDLVLGTESLDKLDVFRFGASFDQDAKMCLALVECFSGLA